MKTENLQIQIVRWSYDKQYNECSVRMKYTMKCNDEAEKKWVVEAKYRLGILKK